MTNCKFVTQRLSMQTLSTSGWTFSVARELHRLPGGRQRVSNNLLLGLTEVTLRQNLPTVCPFAAQLFGIWLCSGYTWLFMGVRISNSNLWGSDWSLVPIFEAIKGMRSQIQCTRLLSPTTVFPSETVALYKPLCMCMTSTAVCVRV